MSINTHGKILEEKLKELDDKLKTLKVNKELYKLIQQPSFTTPQDVVFLTHLVDSINERIGGIERALKIIHESSKMIVEAKQQTT